ncbi:hypothetical protein CRG98_039582 [Punica granatum]|uniref:Uncharacterized protein n=1 Tax=Punica granatum TaxID=22663 RepID=A0A2I0I7Q8_PUNGR|nr:hypothetical protein CRG98_039582 [Punica granatum]
MALLKDQNRASSSYTPPLKNRLTVNQNPVVPPTFVSKNKEAPMSAMTHVPVVYSVTDPLPPPPAPTVVPLPPAAFLSADSTVHAPPPLAMPVQPLVYTVLPPTISPLHNPLKQMNVDMSDIRASKTTVRAFNDSRREVNGEIDFLIDVGPCSFSVAF